MGQDYSRSCGTMMQSLDTTQANGPQRQAGEQGATTTNDSGNTNRNSDSTQNAKETTDEGGNEDSAESEDEEGGSGSESDESVVKHATAKRTSTGLSNEADHSISINVAEDKAEAAPADATREKQIASPNMSDSESMGSDIPDMGASDSDPDISDIDDPKYRTGDYDVMPPNARKRVYMTLLVVLVSGIILSVVLMLVFEDL